MDTITQQDNLIDRCYTALTEGIGKQQLDMLLMELELYTQQRELEKMAMSINQNPQLN